MLTREEIDKIDITKLKKVHLIGITSGFNSFCAEYLLQLGINVKASEINTTPGSSEMWLQRGVLYPGAKHSGDYITEDLDLVVYPNGPIPGNPECQRAEELDIPAITIAQLTGLISKNFKVIAIAGTHGKTTTSAYITWLLKNAYGYLPNFIIGDNILEINKSYNYNPESEYLVIEACEYKRQFLDRAPAPYISVITNIELDHTDYYQNQEDYNSAFSEFLNHTQKAIILDKSQLNIDLVLSKIDIKNDVDIVNTKDLENEYQDIKAPMSGSHNHENFLRACGVAKVLNMKIDLNDFPGVSSRFEYKGETVNGMKVYLDYAHNPKKVRSCLQGAKEQYPDKKILFVWQPHSYERTYHFKDEFAQSLNDADMVLIPNIYAPIREKDQFKDLINEEIFVNYLKEKNQDKEISYTKDFENTANILNDSKYNRDYVGVFASAGDLKNIFNSLNLKE